MSNVDTSAVRARALEAARLLAKVKHAPYRVRAESHGASVLSTAGLTMAWCGATWSHGPDGSDGLDASEAEAVARLILAAPRLMAQLAADVVALAEIVDALEVRR